MNSVTYYIILIIVMYALWTIILEGISKKYSTCFCITLKIYIFAGVIALLLMHYHVKNGCSHHESLTEIAKMPISVLVGILLIAIMSIMANKYWIKAIEDKNAGYVSALTSTYIIIVAIASAFLFKSKITRQHYFGILAIIGGTYLLVK
jgi:drug/metabolite transporter (DMT)-like permease